MKKQSKETPAQYRARLAQNIVHARAVINQAPAFAGINSTMADALTKAARKELKKTPAADRCPEL